MEDYLTETSNGGWKITYLDRVIYYGMMEDYLAG